MFDMKSLSAQIRKKKKMDGQADLRQDMDYAGQEGVDPTVAEEQLQASRINETLGDPEHEPASADEMGENESSQSKMSLKKAMARINKYFDEMMS